MLSTLIATEIADFSPRIVQAKFSTVNWNTYIVLFPHSSPDGLVRPAKTYPITWHAEGKTWLSGLHVHDKQSFTLWQMYLRSLTWYLLFWNLHQALKISSKRLQGVNKRNNSKSTLRLALLKTTGSIVEPVRKDSPLQMKMKWGNILKKRKKKCRGVGGIEAEGTVSLPHILRFHI